MTRPDDAMRPTGSRRLSRRALLRSFAASAVATSVGSDVPASDAAAAPPSRWWSSLVWAVFENRTFAQVAGLSSHRRLAREGTVLTRYFAVAHPSGPNYRAMASGETWGRREIVDTFHPSVASLGAAAKPAIPTYVYHLMGRIARQHDPIADLRAPVAGVRHGLDALRRDLVPDRCLVYAGWDNDNDLHNGYAARGDANLNALLDTLARSMWFNTPDGAGRFPALFFCYDEDNGSGGNRVFAAFWGRGVRRGAASDTHHTHYGFCRTMSDNWGLAPLGHAAKEAAITEVWM